MSDQQAQELTRNVGAVEVLALCKAAAKVRGGAWIEGAPTHVLAEMSLALERDGWVLARAPVQVERPDEPRFTLTIHGCPARNEPMGERIAAVLEADGYDCTVAAARLPERPDEGLTEAMVEAAARAMANDDGWGWHADDYEAPDPNPKWQATDKDGYRTSARVAIKAALAARPTPSATERAPTV